MTFFFRVLFSLFFVVGAMCFVTSVKICTMMIEVLSDQSRCQFYIHTECCCCCCCCCCAVCCNTAVGDAAALLLLPATGVRHRVPDGQICCWFTESDPSIFSSHFDEPLGSTVSHLRPRFAFILRNYGHARSQGENQPAAAKPALYNNVML